MTRRVNPARKRAPAAATLGPGVHPAKVELAAGGTFRVRTLAGVRVEAAAADGVEPGLAEECLREGRTVLVADSATGPLILGALQTRRSPLTVEEGVVRLDAEHLRLSADKTITIEAGPVRMRVDPSGVLRLEGERLVVDMGALVRFLSARVELP
jgi:hypothetical protein